MMQYIKILLITLLTLTYYVHGLNLNDFKDRVIIKTKSIEPGSIVYNFNIGIANLSKDVSQKELASQLKMMFEESRSNFESLKTVLNKYKIILAAAGFSALYFSVLYKIVKTNNLLNSSNSWISWKSDLNFEKFISMPQNNLAKELIIEINKRYQNNLLNPFLNFIDEINLEISYLQSYIKLINYLKFLYLDKLYQINNDSINVVQEKINRLNYLKNLFLNNVISKNSITIAG